MGLFDRFRNPASAVAAGTAQGLMQGVGELAVGIRTAITGVDPAVAGEIDKLLIEVESKAVLAQAETNKIEAANPKIFIAGWRPAIGWCCALAVFYKFFGRPLLVAFGVAEAPDIDAAALWPIMMGMLGLGTMRTYEKRVNVVDQH